MNGVYINEEQINNTLRPTSWRSVDQNNPETDIALYSELVTDVMVVKLNKLPKDTNLLGAPEGFNNEKVKSAWDSLAELVSKQIGLIEDFEPGEISVGRMYNSYETDAGEINGWSFYISDNLDNGAGYASQYSQKEKFNHLIQSIESDMMDDYLLKDDHPETCSTSCYHCIRNYFNRMDHQRLDWRLALDLLQFFKDEDAVTGFETPWWDSYINKVLPKKMSGLTSSKFTIKKDPKFGSYLLNDQNIAVLPIHPLQHVGHLDYVDLKNEFLDAVGVTRGGTLDIYEFERKPVVAIQKIRGGG